MEEAMLNVGIIGLGGISAKHIKELSESPDAKIVAICDIDTAKLEKIGSELGISEEYRFTDYNALVDCDMVDAVEICTPNHMHIPMAMKCLEAGKPIELEKPISVNCRGIDELLDKINRRGVVNMTCFSYRFMPAVRYAKRLMESGAVGRIINVSVEYLKDSAFMEGRRLEWRFVKEYAGSGVLGDLGVHLIDMTRFLVGDFENVYAMKNIIIDKRKRLDSEEEGSVETDDIVSFIARLENNVIANFTVTRCARGNSNTIKYEIYGTEGVIVFNLNDPAEIGIFKDNTLVTEKVPEKFFIKQEQTFVDAVLGREVEYFPDIFEGAACQRIVDAVLESSETGMPVSLK